MIEKIKETQRYLLEQGIGKVDFGLILGSGLGDLADRISEAIIVDYKEIPHFPVSSVAGHAGKLVYGKLAGKNVLALQGRFHYYEGNSMGLLTYPIRVLKALGAHSLIVTNAAGGVNLNYHQGELMLIRDHINFMGNHPLIGPNEDALGPRFPDMSHAYDETYRSIAKQSAAALNIPLQEGVYMAFSGPSYETPAEIAMARVMGADAVGMSTVPEVIVANHGGLRVLGISCITNLAAGMQISLNHEEVVETTQRVKQQFEALVMGILAAL